MEARDMLHDSSVNEKILAFFIIDAVRNYHQDGHNRRPNRLKDETSGIEFNTVSI
jgi:hypothetical protein